METCVMDDAWIDCSLSLVLPAFNEEAGIAEAVREADDALRQLGIRYEIIVVDDGSSDQTAAVVAETMRDLPCARLIRHDVNRGYGAALRSGFDAARGQRIAFTDADCQFDLADLALLLPLTEKHPIAVGFRLDRQDTWLRKFYSRGYNLLARTLLGAGVRDIDCALKVFRRDALQKIIPQTDGFFVNTEMLTLARQHHLSIGEVGVRHRPRQRGDSKVSIRDVPRVLRALLPFWWTRVLFPGSPSPLYSGERGWGEGCISRGCSPLTPDPSPPSTGERGVRGPSLALRAQVLLMLSLFAMTCLLFGARVDHPLLEPEEARYAEIPRQMLLEGRFLTPVLHGEDYWQKPPLLYWLVMLSYKAFGVHDWAARLVPVLAGILCVGITTAWAWRTLGFWAAHVSGTILTLSVRFLYLAGMLSMDGLLCTFVLAGLACGHLALTESKRRWVVLSAIACGLGVLTKGPVAIVLIVMPLIALALLDRRCRFLSKIEACIYAAIVGLIAGPWFVAMALAAPQAAGSFFWLHHLVRYFAPIDHEKPAWFYVPSLLLGMMPWTLLLIPLIPYLTRKSLRAGQRRPAALGFFLLAFGWCLLFFSLSGCKRPGYILPALPLAALILGTLVTHGLPWQRWMHAVSEIGHRSARRLTFATLAVGFAISVAVGVSELWSWPAATITAVAFMVAAIAISRTPMRLPTWTSWAGCAVVGFLVLGFGQRTWLPDYHDRFGLRRQVEISSEYEQEELPIVTYPKRWDSVSFYAPRHKIDSYTPADFAKLVHDLHKHGKAIVFVKREGSLTELLNALPDHLEVELLGRDEDFVAVMLVRPREGRRVDPVR
jgi:4-amino-4-deoxy-L-arabinose transferase-like glycosyltransferase